MSNSSNSGGVVRIDHWGNPIDPPPPARGGVPLFGIFLIVLGVLLAAGQFFGVAAVGASAFFLALGVILLASGIRDHSDVALYAGLFVSANAVAGLLTGLGVVQGGGWGTLLFGASLIALALWRMRTGRRPVATLVFGALFAAWGGLGVVAANLNVGLDRFVGPVLIVLLGLWLVSRSRRARA
jgi:hypothetical protein